MKCHDFSSFYHYVRMKYEKEKECFPTILCHNFCLFQKKHTFAQYNYN